MDAKQLRREGMAEAVVRIILSRRAPLIPGEVWCDLLGISHRDIREAMLRLKVNPATPLVEDRPVVPTSQRRVRRDGQVDGRHLNHQRRVRMTECQFCDKPMMVGKRYVDHMASFHPREYAEERAARIMADYADAECPDCGAPITVKVTVEVERSCSCHAEPTYYCSLPSCQQDVPLTGLVDHEVEHLNQRAAQLQK